MDRVPDMSTPPQPGAGPTITMGNADVGAMSTAAPRRWTVDEIERLLEICRDKCVRNFSGEGLEFSFERPQPSRRDD